MATLESEVPLIQAAADSLAQFLEALSSHDLQRPSACDLWEIRDVVAHLSSGADLYTDIISRGLRGDPSRPNLQSPLPIPAVNAQSAIHHRQALGAQLLPTFRTSYTALTALLVNIHGPAWDTPCHYWPQFGPLPARTFVALTAWELAIHSWDICSRFDANAALSAELLPLFFERIPKRFAWLPDYAAFLLYPERDKPVRYRWQLTGVNACAYDLIVESGKARMEAVSDAAADVTLQCDDSTFALLMNKRLTLTPAMAQGRLAANGDQALTMALDEWLKQI